MSRHSDCYTYFFINYYKNFRKNVQLLKKCEVQMLEGAMKYLEETISKLPTAAAEEKSNN